MGVNTQGGPLEFEFDIRLEKLEQKIKTLERDLGHMSDNAIKQGQEIDRIWGKIWTTIGTVLTAAAFASFGKNVALVRGEFQQLEVAFETMLGSKEKSDKLMAEVVEFAAKTPFELKDVAGGTKQLLAYGIAAEDIIPTLKALGDVSAGLSVPIERLILNYGQVRTQTKLTGRELRDFNVSGVPLIAELARNLNQTEQEIQEMVSAGEIGFTQVEEAFRTMTSEGGRFADLMDKQAGTITGQLSNISDAIAKMMNDIGLANEGIINKSLGAVRYLIEHYEFIIKLLKEAVIIYGSYKTAVLLAAAAKRIQTEATKGYTIAMQLEYTWLLLTEKAQKVLNATILKNPYVFAATAIMSLISALLIFRKRTDEAAEAQEKIQKASQEANTRVAEERVQIENLMKVAKDEQISKAKRKEAIEKINEIMGDYNKNIELEKINTEEVTEAIKAYLKVKQKQFELTALESQMQAITAEVVKLKQELDEPKVSGFGPWLNKQLQFLGGYEIYLANQQRIVREETNETIDILEGQYEKLGELYKKAFEEYDKMTEGGTKGKPKITYEEELKEFKDYIKKQKQLYEDFENYKKVYGVEKAKEQYPELLNTYKDFLVKLRSEYQADRNKGAMIAAELAPIFADEQLEKLPRIMSEYEEKLHSLLWIDKERVGIIKRITREQIEQAELLRAQAEAGGKLSYHMFQLAQVFANIAYEIGQMDENLANIAMSIARTADSIGVIKSNQSTDVQKVSAMMTIANLLINTYKGIWETAQKTGQDEAVIASIDRLNQSISDLLNNADYLVGIDRINALNDALNAIKDTADDLMQRNAYLSDYTFAQMLGIDSIEDIDIAEIRRLIAFYESIAVTHPIEQTRDKARANIAILEQLIELQRQYVEEQNKLFAEVIGTNITTIADSIADGFAKGLTSVEDFATDMNKIISNAIIKSFQANIIDKQIQEWYSAFGESILSDNTLTTQEAQRSKAALEAIIRNSAEAFEQYRQMLEELGLWEGEMEQPTLAGAIKGITEDTANVLAGQMNAMRIIGIKQSEIAESSLNYLVRISDNTSFNRRIPEVINGLQDVKNAIDNSILNIRASGG